MTDGTPPERRGTLRERLEQCERRDGVLLARRLQRYPYFAEVEHVSGAEIRIAGHTAINLGSNNYLGLADDPRVVAASIAAIQAWGAGVTGSRLLNGNLALHERLEEDLARFFGFEAALVFPTGYTANLGLLSALLGRSDRILLDADAHASLIDGALLSRAQIRRFRHNDAQHLAEVLAGDRPTACVVEGLYSMLGDVAPLPAIADACQTANATLIVDEAHSVGVLGPGGRGAAAAFGITGRVDFLTITFSKSLASCGGAVLGSAAAIQGLRIECRPFIFTASNTPGSLAAAQQALDILRAEPERVERLHRNARYLRGSLEQAGFVLEHGEGPVLAIRMGSDFRTMQAWKMLLNRGVFCNCVLSPGVEEGEELLRLSVTAAHTPEQLDSAAQILRTVLPLARPVRSAAPPLSEEKAA